MRQQVCELTDCVPHRCISDSESDKHIRSQQAIKEIQQSTNSVRFGLAMTPFTVCNKTFNKTKIGTNLASDVSVQDEASSTATLKTLYCLLPARSTFTHQENANSNKHIN